MSSKMTFLFGVPMFFGGCAILWIYWDRLKKPKKKIFISADCWLSVFDLLEPSQLGLGISMISHRFDFYVDEHFKTRKWALKHMQIWRKIGKNGTTEMKIGNYYDKALPIPQVQLPRKVIGFERIKISYIDQNAIAFLHRFRSLFASCPINVSIYERNDRTLEFVLRNIWPMIAKNIRGMFFYTDDFHHLRKFVPSILNDCPSLLIVKLYNHGNFFIEFPCDDNAMASDGQAVAKWLFTPHPNNVPKLLNCWLKKDGGNLAPMIEAFKAAFASASTPVNFIVVFWFPPAFADSVVPFNRTNEMTREQLALKRTDFSNCFLFVRCPIGRDESKWTKWEEKAIGRELFYQWNAISISITDTGEIEDGPLDAIPGSSDQRK